MSKKKKLMIAGGGVGAVIVLFLVLIFTHVICINHVYLEATCTKPKTCKYCGREDGEPLGHKFSEATCTKAKICSVCNATDGEPLGHDWKDATCTESQKCSRCNETQGEPLGHKAGDWEVEISSTFFETGKKVRKCEHCQKELQSKETDVKKLSGIGFGNELNVTPMELVEAANTLFRNEYKNLSIDKDQYINDENGNINWGINFAGNINTMLMIKADDCNNDKPERVSIAGVGKREETLVIASAFIYGLCDTELDMGTIAVKILEEKAFKCGGVYVQGLLKDKTLMVAIVSDTYTD